VKKVESGYYLVVAVHSVYYEKHSNINDAQNTMASKGNKPYNGNMSMVKIEN